MTLSKSAFSVFFFSDTVGKNTTHIYFHFYFLEKDIILESQFENLNWNGFLKGKHIDDAYGITTEEINDQLQPIYFHCNLLIQDAVQSEIENYMNQKNPNKPFF